MPDHLRLLKVEQAPTECGHCGHDIEGGMLYRVEGGKAFHFEPCPEQATAATAHGRIRLARRFK